LPVPLGQLGGQFLQLFAAGGGSAWGRLREWRRA